MSFPNIPDIDPYINITFEDAINLLLSSIAMEEMSLSKLMDAETNKILCVLDNCCHLDCKNDDCCQVDCGHKDCLLHDALAINKSVDDTIKNMIKLQMLLQFKLDNIKEIFPCKSSTTTTSTSTSTTTTTSTSTSTTTTSTTSTCSTTTKRCCCCLTGNGKGCVPKCCNEFYNHMAALYACICCRDNVKNRTIRYFVENGETSLRMYASGYNVKIKCPGQCCDKLVVFGKGYVEKRCNPDITGNVDFILTVCKKAPDNLEFRMEIKSDKNPKLNHDSGFVQVNRAISNLQLTIFC